MNIVTSPKPYVASASKLARLDVQREIARLNAVVDPAEQTAGSRLPLEIGGVATFWSRGLSPHTPVFLQHTVSGVKRVHLLSADKCTVGVYDNATAQTWERRALLRTPEDIVASLPKKAFAAEPSTAPASPKQIGALRKMLELSPSIALPPLSSAAASRLIDRFTVERPVVQLYEDFTRWLKEDVAAVAA